MSVTRETAEEHTTAWGLLQSVVCFVTWLLLIPRHLTCGLHLLAAILEFIATSFKNSAHAQDAVYFSFPRKYFIFPNQSQRSLILKKKSFLIFLLLG